MYTSIVLPFSVLYIFEFFLVWAKLIVTYVICVKTLKLLAIKVLNFGELGGDCPLFCAESAPTNSI